MERELIVREEELLTYTVVVIPALAQSNLFRGFSLDRPEEKREAERRDA